MFWLNKNDVFILSYEFKQCYIVRIIGQNQKFFLSINLKYYSILENNLVTIVSLLLTTFSFLLNITHFIFFSCEYKCISVHCTERNQFNFPILLDFITFFSYFQKLILPAFIGHNRNIFHYYVRKDNAVSCYSFFGWE